MNGLYSSFIHIHAGVPQGIIHGYLYYISYQLGVYTDNPVIYTSLNTMCDSFDEFKLGFVFINDIQLEVNWGRKSLPIFNNNGKTRESTVC